MNAGSYGYLVIGVALLAGYLRMSRARRIAEAHIARRQSPYSVTMQFAVAAILLTFAVAVAAFALLHRERPWLWLGSAVAALSGAQALGTAMLPLDKLVIMIRSIGAAFMVLAVVMYFMLVRA